MFEDGWYSIVPEVTSQRLPTSPQVAGHYRKESLLQQSSAPGEGGANSLQTLGAALREIEDANSPPLPELRPRAASYSNVYSLTRSSTPRDRPAKSRRNKAERRLRGWEALALCHGEALAYDDDPVLPAEPFDSQLLEESSQEYLLYQDQLRMTERHLDGLISDASEALKLLTTLSSSFQSVEAQTSTFQEQCEGLVTEQKRLEKLAEEVGTDLHYYAFLETATRRLNSPGASRLVDDDDFGDLVANIDSCIGFMNDHPDYRERESYLARFNALLTKALHLLDHGFTNHLQKVSSDIARQIAAAKSESARHAIAYARFEEMMLDSRSLIPNVQRIVRRAYHHYGEPVESTSTTSIYVTASFNMFHTYFTTRDRDLKLTTQHELQEFQKEVKDGSIETASRIFIKQSFERTYNEDNLFTQIFDLEPVWNAEPESAFQSIKTISTTMVHPGNLMPLATNVQHALQNAQLQEVCSVVGWLASEYSIAMDVDEEESPLFRKHREYAARLLADHLWAFTDGAFDTELAKSISKAPMRDDQLQLGPVSDGVASSNAHPVVKRAMELLAMFDGAMPKERSTKNSSVVFKIVRETMQFLQKAEARIKYLKADKDADLFMVKNLLILRNVLVSLEMGDIRSQPASTQQFGQIWDALSPQTWVSFFGSIIGSQLWSRGEPSVTAKTLSPENMSEQLDELLRQSIVAFTRSWASSLNDARGGKAGARRVGEVEAALEKHLQTAFSSQPEIIERFWEAVQLNASGVEKLPNGSAP